MTARRKVKIENLYLDDVYEIKDVIDILHLQDKEAINLTVKSSKIVGCVVSIEFVVNSNESVAVAQMVESALDDFGFRDERVTVTIHVAKNK